MKKALGIDVGGTKISYAIIDENGDFVTKIKYRRQRLHTARNFSNDFEKIG